MDILLKDNLHIRSMRKEDLGTLAQWASEAFTSVNSGLLWTIEKMLIHLRDDFNEKHSFVVYDDSGLVGGIMAYPCRYDRGEEIFIHTFIIRKEKRKSGIGTAFFKWFIGYAKTQQVTGIRLDAHTKLPSYAWYKQFEFQPSGWEQQLRDL